IYKIPLIFAKRLSVGIAFNKILANFGRNTHQQVTKMSQKREVANNGVFRLDHIIDSNHCYRNNQQVQPPERRPQPAQQAYHGYRYSSCAQKFLPINIEHEKLIEHSSVG